MQPDFFLSAILAGYDLVETMNDQKIRGINLFGIHLVSDQFAKGCRDVCISVIDF